MVLQMIGRLFPAQIDNRFAGSKLALLLLAAVTLLKGAMGFNSIAFGHMVASQADGIPLDTYPAACAQAILSGYGSWGAGMLVLCALSLLALFRYRSMVPLIFVLLLLEQLGRKVAHLVAPVASTASAADAINLTLTVILILGLLLSVWVPWARAEDRRL